MAKVTLILEDMTDPDGKPGLLIDWESGDEDFKEDSLAHSYAAAFIDYVVGQGKQAEIIDKRSVDTDMVPPETDPTLN